MAEKFEGEIPRILGKWLLRYHSKDRRSASFAAYVTMLAVDQNKCEKAGEIARDLFTKYFDKHFAINRWARAIESNTNLF